jgi:hypothetical protein
MKWINFGERPPDSALPNNNLHFKLTSSGERLPYSTYFDTPRKVLLTFPNRRFEEYKPNELEWLDESAEEKLHETLPEFDSWDAFYEHYMLSEHQPSGGIMGFMENTLPHGFKVGKRYKV